MYSSYRLHLPTEPTQQVHNECSCHFLGQTPRAIMYLANMCCKQHLLMPRHTWEQLGLHPCHTGMYLPRRTKTHGKDHNNRLLKENPMRQGKIKLLVLLSIFPSSSPGATVPTRFFWTFSKFRYSPTHME